MLRVFFLFLLLSFVGCTPKKESKNKSQKESISKIQKPTISSTSLVILGTIQDAGSPHIGCEKICCDSLFDRGTSNRKVVSLGLIDPESKKTFLIEATPDIASQMKTLLESIDQGDKKTPDGILLTHAHIGHYAGIMYLGKEAMNAKNASVYAMPRMKTFLEKNGPWSQLVKNQNILITEIQDQKEIKLTKNISVTPILVPHRDEYSETVGYKIKGPSKKCLFIPDIDKWNKWEKDIIKEIKNVDYAFLDATFYSGKEINNRSIKEIPHPFIIESMALFKDLPLKEKNKIHFIHFNHTNPVLNNSPERKEVEKKGFKIAKQNDVIKL
ncbi:MAG: MBL fold metallo-hydrolase [Crocinitomicaceae bacterium]|nr:MBL fold metallo-hydrolase [Crocinitomicaceae bacterium]